jgi:hypothetical protein
MHGWIAKTAFLAMTALLAGGVVARGQTSDPPPPASATEDEQRNIFTLQVENDVFNRFSPTDRDYTNGIRIGWLSPAITWLPSSWVALTTVPTFFGEGPSDSVVRRFGVSLGQNLYTPDNIFTSQPIYNDRPYAAWLCASFLLQPHHNGTIRRPADSRCGSTRCRSIRPDRPGGRRRVRAEQFPQADRCGAGQRLGQPAP